MLGTWAVVLLVSLLLAPDWNSVVENGEFAFLPESSPSRVAEEYFNRTFPEKSLASTVALVLRRETSSDGLLDKDKAFIRDVLVPNLRSIVGFEEEQDKPADGKEAGNHPIVTKLQWFGGNRHTGDLYESDDGKASLIVLELRTEFLDQANEGLIVDVEEFLKSLRLKPDGHEFAIPKGLDVAFSGSATFGRDMIRAQIDSAKSTEKWTVILVVFLLIIIYRAPLLALIPLITVAISTAISIALLSIAAKCGIVNLFNGIEVYVTVLVYGAGVDYCLFLIARYREELNAGATIEEAVAQTLEKVGPALAASAGTTICGIGMMIFAEFGKFQQAGIAITSGLAVCLTAALTFTPAVLRLFGRWAFWPNVPTEKVVRDAAWHARSDVITRLLNSNFLQEGWHRIGQLLLRRPWAMWIGSILGLMPFSVIGLVFYGYLSYGLLSELPDTAASVHGAKALQTHFPSGEMAPIDAVLTVPGADFTQKSGTEIDALKSFTEAIVAQKDAMGLHTVRSLVSPKGQRPINTDGMSRLEQIAFSAAVEKHARDLYLSREYPDVARVELVFTHDPFSRSSIREFQDLQDTLPKLVPQDFQNATLHFKGETANISDLKDVTDRDQVRIDVLVLAGVFTILWILLRRPGICAYLMISVFFSYLAALGMTFVIFWAMDPSGFAGLDWKVPMFLFTILIAVGVDYNIFLMTRIKEEQLIHGDVQGIPIALERTGSIISSCGIIMAGTFSSLLAGSLVGMDQLGLALALGVLLDTFVVRPVLVPAFLVLLTRGSLGRMSEWAGYSKQQ